MRKIELLISPQGESTLKTHGYAGADCLEASKWLEQALGLTLKEQKTADYYQAAHAQEEVPQQS